MGQGGRRQYEARTFAPSRRWGGRAPRAHLGDRSERGDPARGGRASGLRDGSAGAGRKCEGGVGVQFSSPRLRSGRTCGGKNKREKAVKAWLVLGALALAQSAMAAAPEHWVASWGSRLLG